MSKHGIKRVDNDLMRITYVAPTTSTGVDSAKLKATYPHIYTECSKTTSKKGYVKITVKGDKT